VGFSPPNKTWWGKPHPTENRPAVSIFNAEDKIAAEWFEKFNKDAGRICIRFSTDDVSKEIRDSFTLPGRANLSNLAAAIAISKYFGIDDNSIKNSLPEFKSLPHRLELVEEINGVRWYNDSIATTPQSAIAALEAFDQPKIIIAGGYDKGLPFEELGQKIATNAKAAILIGQTAPKIANAIKLFPQAGVKIQIVNSLYEAVESAARLAEPCDVVLLSPACASYDMFENFQQRGQEFITHVRALTTD
jgi:UDP-N-acetylmuramoylalanine--D-glutamate ligase